MYIQKFTKNSLFLILLFGFNFTTNAQQNNSKSVEFKAVRVNKESQKSLDKNLKNYSLFRLDNEAIRKYALLNKNQNIFLKLTFPEIESFNLKLWESEVLSPDYQLIIASENGKQNLTERKQITYEGNITNQENNKVRLTITNDIIYGIIKTVDKEYFIEPMNYMIGGTSKNIFVLYETKDILLAPSATCGVTEVKKEVEKLSKNRTQLDLGDCYRVEIAIASDESAVIAVGGSAFDMEVYNIALMNTVAPYFNNFEFPTNVELVLAGQYISTSVATDPYSVDCTSCTMNDQLNNFGTWAINGGFGSINYTLAHNITNHFPPPGPIGLAHIGVLGQQNNHGLSNFSEFSTTWLVFIHQLGHNFGMRHSFEDGSGTTGGFMDLGDGKWNGQYSWNPQYREIEFEQEVNSAPIMTCSSIGPAVSDFSSNNLVCIGSTLQFENRSLGGATSYSWTFSGGDPATSTDFNTSVVFSTVGEKTVSLTATNENGSNTITKNIIVIDGPDSVPCSNSGTWSGNSNDGGSTFFALNTINKISGGSQTDGNYYFDYSCTDNTILEEGTTYRVVTNDLYSSQDMTRYQLFIDYNNNGDFSDANEFIYDGTNQTFSLTTPNTVLEKNKLLRARLIVKSQATGVDPCWSPIQGLSQVEDYGVYFLDTNTLGIAETPELSFSVYPNPSKDGDFTINMHNATKETELLLYNSLGQIIYRTYLQPQANNTIKLNSSIASGIYFIEVIKAEKRLTKKLVIH